MLVKSFTSPLRCQTVPATSLPQPHVEEECTLRIRSRCPFVPRYHGMDGNRSGESSVTIEGQLQEDQKAAMRAGDKATLNAIRSVQSEVATAKSAPGFSGAVDDDLYRSTIATYVKRIRKSRDEYLGMGDRGQEQASKLDFEIDYLTRYLPRTLDEAATRALVEKVVGELGADASTPPGQVIGAVMRSGEDVDGAMVNRLVVDVLGS
jgi:uncharacterized protein YqeY